jgi:hypothetical protein
LIRKPMGQVPSGAAVPGEDLQTIFDSHQRTLRLMRTFAPSPPDERRKPADPHGDRQQDLFASL